MAKSFDDLVKRTTSKKTRDQAARAGLFNRARAPNGVKPESPWRSHGSAKRVGSLLKEEHHRTRTFQEEFRLSLERHGVTNDQRYAWE